MHQGPLHKPRQEQDEGKGKSSNAQPQKPDQEKVTSSTVTSSYVVPPKKPDQGEDLGPPGGAQGSSS